MNTETQVKTLAQFIAENRITMSASRTDGNPHMDEIAGMDHWQCIITNEMSGYRFKIVFSKGSGHKGKRPEIAEVLDCMASDAGGIESAPCFEDWCSEYGYDSDSRKAERTFKAVEKQTDDLKSLLGSSFSELLYEIERQ